MDERPVLWRRPRAAVALVGGVAVIVAAGVAVPAVTDHWLVER